VKFVDVLLVVMEMSVIVIGFDDLGEVVGFMMMGIGDGVVELDVVLLVVFDVVLLVVLDVVLLVVFDVVFELDDVVIGFMMSGLNGLWVFLLVNFLIIGVFGVVDGVVVGWLVELWVIGDVLEVVLVVLLLFESRMYDIVVIIVSFVVMLLVMRVCLLFEVVLILVMIVLVIGFFLRFMVVFVS